VSSAPQDTLSLAKKVVFSPPVIALIISAILRLLQVQNFQEPSWVLHLYQFAKVGMVFTGMCVLGMWLRHTKVEKADLWHSVRVMLPKLMFGAIICSCLPPAANIVALETHYQGTGYSARYIAAGTIVSIVVILIFGLVWHVLKG
jgi:predicted permease